MRDLEFIPGLDVEVNIDPDNSFDVWFPATFLKQLANFSFLVEYRHSKEAELQNLTVDSLRIRPPPPCSSHKAFHLLDKVDAFCESRWLSGVVTKILADQRYIIYFKRIKKEKELSHTDLRLHMEWNNGKWTQSSQDTMKSTSEKRVNFDNGGSKETWAASEGSVKNNVSSDRISTTNLRISQNEYQTLDNEKTNHQSATSSNKRVKRTSANGNASLSGPLVRTNEEPVSDMELSNSECKSKTKHVGASNHENPADLDSYTAVKPVQSDINQSEYSSLVKDDNEKLSASRKRPRPQRLRGLVSGEALEDTGTKTPTKSDAVKPPFGPIVVGLTHNGKMIDSLGDTLSQHMKLEPMKFVEGDEKKLDDHESVEIDQQKGEVSKLKRKRGRPPKSQIGSPKTNETECVKQEKKDDASDAKDDDESVSPTCELGKLIAVVKPSGTSNSVSDLRIRRVMKINDQMKWLSDIRRRSMRCTSKKQIRKRKVPTALVLHDLTGPVKSVVKKGKKQKSSEQVKSLTEDAVDNSRSRAIEVFSNGIDKAVAGTSSNASDDDRPLSAWFEGAVSPPAIDFRIPSGSITDLSDESTKTEEIKAAVVVGQFTEQDKLEYASVENIHQIQYRNGTGRPEETAIQSQSTAIVPVEERDLPFVKNSPIWQMVENMDILKSIPQKPHFRPLYNCKEECREGLAIGSMVTFTTLMERITKSRFSDSRSLLDGYLEALVDLEQLGFNVSPVREQLNKLISLKGKYEQAETTSKEIESQIREHNLEKSMINEEMADLDRKIAELTEKRALVVSKRERKEAEITLLQTSIDAVKGTLETAEKEFEKITSALW